MFDEPSQNQDLVTYFPDGGVRINLDNILTRNKTIYPKKLYLKSEGIHMDVVHVLKIWDEDGMIQLLVQEKNTDRIYNINHVLDPDIKYFVWWLVEYEFFIDALENRIMDRIKNKL